MTPDNSLIQAYLKTHPETQSTVNGTLLGKFTSGNSLVTAHLAPMVDWAYARIAEKVGAADLNEGQARMYIEELSVFARYNAQFLKAAATSVEGFCPELAHELRRNHLEEGGERGKVPAHYVLYTNALLADLGLDDTGPATRVVAHEQRLSRFDRLLVIEKLGEAKPHFPLGESLRVARKVEARRIPSRPPSWPR